MQIGAFASRRCVRACSAEARAAASDEAAEVREIGILRAKASLVDGDEDVGEAREPPARDRRRKNGRRSTRRRARVLAAFAARGRAPDPAGRRGRRPYQSAPGSGPARLQRTRAAARWRASRRSARRAGRTARSCARRCTRRWTSPRPAASPTRPLARERRTRRGVARVPKTTEEHRGARTRDLRVRARADNQTTAFPEDAHAQRGAAGELAAAARSRARSSPGATTRARTSTSCWRQRWRTSWWSTA